MAFSLSLTLELVAHEETDLGFKPGCEPEGWSY